MNTRIQARTIRLAGPLLGLAFFLTAPGRAEHGPTDSDTSYSFARVIEGPSTVIAASGERDAVDAQMPLFVGDRLWVPYDSRVELVLADRSLLRVQGDAEIDFRAIAYSADSDDAATELELRRGEIQIVVPEEALGETLPVVLTPDATIYVHEPGTFRVEVSREGRTELVVRDGLAEMVGDRGASLVYPGDLAVVEGGRWRSDFDVRRAASYDSLERWGERLTLEAAYASVPHVDRSLHYAAAPLAEHGVWVTVGGRSAWRPRVAATWRPYHHGYWRSAPTGLIWVSHDPWGHVTHHYGLWDYVPGYGWVWYPGRDYRTAWVHWYWGPSYVGWCPSGYYAGLYGRDGHDRGFGLSFGIYGYAGGSWSRFEHWSFTAAVDFGRRDQHRHVRSGKEMGRVVSTRELGRGIITTDAGAAGRKDPREIVNLLESEVRDYRRTTGRELPDVSDYVARKPLPGNLREAIVKPKPVARPKPEVKPKPIARTKPSVVPRDLPGSSTGKDPGRVGTTRPPRTPLPRVEAPKPSTKPYRVDRPEDRGREREIEPPKPSTKPYRVERPEDRGREREIEPPKPSTKPYRVDRPEDRGREREIEPRDRHWRDRVAKPPLEKPSPPRGSPTVRPRSDDEERTVLVKPREAGRDEARPRASSRDRESPKPRQSISSAKPRQSISSAKPRQSSKPSAKAKESGKSTVKKGTKSSSSAKKSGKKGKN